MSNQPSAPSRFAAGAIDLGQVKAKAETESSLPDRVATISPSTFEQDVVIRSTQVPVIILLGSARSEASENMRMAFESLVAQSESIEWLFRYADVDSTPEVAQAFGVQAIPTVIALANGRPMTNFEGGQPTDQLQQWVAAVVQATAGKLQGLQAEEASDPRLDAAADKLAAEDYDGAIADYDAILSAEPGNADARSARANAMLMRRAAQEGDNPFAEADQLILQGDKTAAFDTLIDKIAARGSDAAAAKERLLELFTLFEAGDSEVIAARTKMASALF
ncbi:thioredoxin [Corynebacterium falsenii DSM 44353]|uniref:tetratricopeptide repeat protein n=1 Tax=Corynebacterium falsenii TaxID=108486 RepID=UPI0003E937E3|nr:tetratricopeptide repeat protein [Corynebacterium falsenii]AHI03450.1 thioredoxin [Corynebacterium falsenii DSM 44353]UBI04153.1 tetratricopeptide repeat protein [Corynebacterium falsenii]